METCRFVLPKLRTFPGMSETEFEYSFFNSLFHSLLFCGSIDSSVAHVQYWEVQTLLALDGDAVPLSLCHLANGRGSFHK